MHLETALEDNLEESFSLVSIQICSNEILSKQPKIGQYSELVGNFIGKIDNQEDKVWLMHLLSSVINLGTVISRIRCIPFYIPLYFTSILTVQRYEYILSRPGGI